MKERRDRLLLISLTLISSIYVYLPFYLRGTIDYIYRYWDGPLYLVVAKTFYVIYNNPFQTYYDWSYSAHFIIYPLFVRLFSFVGYLNSMLLTTQIFTILAILMFYQFLKDFNYVKSPLFVATVFIFLPPKWLIVHSVGASEPVFLFFMLLSIYFFKKEDYLKAGIFGGVATLTRLPGIMLFPAFFLIFLKHKRNRGELIYISIIPASLLMYFGFYYLIFDDFFIYFKVNMGLISSNMPFSAVHYGGISMFYVLIFYAVGISQLFKTRNYDLFTISALMYLPLITLIGADLSRYLFIIFPFILIAFKDIVETKEFKVIFIIFLLPTYIYAWDTIPHNLADPNEFENLKAMLRK